MIRRSAAKDGGGSALPAEFAATGKPLGEGATAVVWPARHRIDGSDVALKVWKTALTDERDRARFLAEARQHRRIAARSPYIVRYVTAGIRDRTHPWIATGRHGTALDNVLRDGRPALRDGAVIGHDILAGLAAIHRAGAVHRDVKPGNVLVDRGRAKVCDLGLAMPADAFTQDTQAGTAWYVAPELAEPGSAPNARTDVYSAAVTIREILPEGASEDLDRLLLDAADAPDRRPADGQEFLDRFVAAAGAAGLPVRDLPPPAQDENDDDEDGPGAEGLFTGTGQDSDGASRNRSLVLAAAAAGIVAVLVGGAAASGLLNLSSDSPGPPAASDGSAQDGEPDVFTQAGEAVAAVRDAVPDPAVPARGTVVGECERGGGMTRSTTVDHTAPATGASTPGTVLAVSEVTWNPGTGEACARLLKPEGSLLHETPSYLALTLCGSPGRCDSDRSDFLFYAGPLKTTSPNGCFAWSVAVSESPDPDVPFPVEETHHVGCG